MLPFNSEISDLRNPFYLIEESKLEYKGQTTVHDRPMHHFVSSLWQPPNDGLLDTRRGFTIRYRPKALSIMIGLFVDVNDCLLRKRLGTSTDGSTVLEADYRMDEVNLPLERSLFEMREVTGTMRRVNLKDVLEAALNPDSAEAPPSRN
jgi:hypothetical protein